MLIKRYIGFLAIVFVVLGIVNQQSSLPNQEIVLEFTDVEVSTTDTQTAITIVKERLHELGASNIHVSENQFGKLKITYHSESDITIIRRALAHDVQLGLNNSPSDVPIEKEVSYDIHVFEIQNSKDADWSLEGTYVLELKSKSQRYFVPISFVSAIDAAENENSKIDALAYKVQRNCVLAINTPFYKIPEVRAGPLSS